MTDRNVVLRVEAAYAEQVIQEESMPRANADLLAETRELWGRRYGRPITDEEAQEIIDNMVAFAEILIEWYLDEQRKGDSSEDPNDPE